jgi:ribosome biogenesis GTPase A
MKLARMAKSVAVDINVKRKAKGLLPRNVRAAVVGYPNVGKSSIINRLLKRKMCETAPRPGVTKSLKWARVADGLDLLDAPGVLPMQILDQAGATRLAICNDIGENSYAVAGVAAVLVEMIKRMPTAGPGVLEMRYTMSVGDMTGEAFLEELAQLLFQGDVNQAAYRVLRDYRVGKFGWIALERPPS